jgi:BolA protein
MYTLSTIEQKLKALGPSALQVFDDSEKHHGHAGYKSGVLSHIRINIASSSFSSMTRLEIHRMIHKLLKEELDLGLHSIVIRATTESFVTHEKHKDDAAI